MVSAAAFRLLLICPLALLAACSTAAKREPVGAVLDDPATLHIPAGDYARAFDAARHELRDAGFVLERVDAWSGVITTRASTSAGFATPWSSDQSSIGQELGDFAHRNRRIVRITFEPAPPAPPAPPTPPTPSAANGEPAAPRTEPFAEPTTDLRAADTDLVMRIRVIVERVQQPGWRIDTSSIRQSSYATDPALVARGMQPTFAVPREEDPLLAARLARRIARP